MGPTGTGTVDPVICKTTGQADGTSAQQKYFCFRKKISWEGGHELAVKSVLNTPFLLGTLRMDPSEVLWQEPNLDPSFDIVSPNYLHPSYTPLDQHKECRSPAGLIC